MPSERLLREKRELVSRHGDWTAHNVELGEGVYTFEPDHPRFDEQLHGYGTHLRRIVQCVADVAGQPLEALRVLDLACLEGGYGIEFARHGAEVVGLEGRSVNVEKARFAQRALGLEKVTFEQGDVRGLSAERHGSFDVVLCLGILYHLDAPDVFSFIERIADVCRRVAVIDTQVSISPIESRTYGSRVYWGGSFEEHSPDTTEEERLRHVWASLDNVESFWLTRASLFNLLSASGFTSVYTCQTPAVPQQGIDRDTIVAVKGERVALRSIPSKIGSAHCPEQPAAGVHPGQPARRSYAIRKLARRAARYVRRFRAQPASGWWRGRGGPRRTGEQQNCPPRGAFRPESGS